VTPQLDAIIAQSLGLEPDQITDDLAYQSVPQWDSLRHVALMVVLEGVLNTRINNDLMVELVSVAAIRNFADTCAAANAKTPAGR
jgi:citrate synthase